MRNRLVFVAVLWASILAVLPVRGDVDATGRWLIQSNYLFHPPKEIESWVQTGTALTTTSGYTGTIAPSSGDFNMSRPPVFPCAMDTRVGTVALDGRTMSGEGVLHDGPTPSSCVFGIPYTFTATRCDNGTIEPGEECDDGNADDDDGCNAFCEVEPCSTCTGEPSSCSPLPAPCCGNGAIEAAEECDDDNDLDADGCSASCVVEPCQVCNGEPSSCSYFTPCCGNGLEFGEECDDLDVDDGDGCSSACKVEECFACVPEEVEIPESGVFITVSSCSPLPPGSPCDDADACTITGCDGSGNCEATSAVECDDGSACTTDDCEPSIGCINQPDVRTCRSAAKSLLLVVDKGDDKDKLAWKWTKGESTSQTDFADPLASAAYELCLFAGTTAVIAEARVAPDAQKWSPLSDKGYRYDDEGGADDGVRKVLLKGSDSDRAKIVLKGKGMNLPAVHPPLALPITAQLRNTQTDICWSATYTSADPNRTGKLKAKSSSP